MDDLLLALRVVVSLGVVVALLWLIQRRVGRGARRPEAPAIRVLGRQGVAGKSSVVVVEVEGERLVLGVSEGRMTVLARRDAATAANAEAGDAADAPSAVGASGAFASIAPVVALSSAPRTTPTWSEAFKRALGSAGLR